VSQVDCRFVDAWLDDWMASRLPADLAGPVDAHVRGCERCRRLQAIREARAESRELRAGVNTPEEDGLLEEVLARTSGRACAEAEALLPSLVDGDLDPTTGEIVRLHLEHCEACSQLAAVLAEAHEVLPSLAEIEPPPGFTTRVLARTSRATRRSPVVEWWLRVLARPHASMELAYVGAIVMVVLVGNPVIAFHGAEEHARRLVGSVPVERIAGELPARATALGLLGDAIGSLGRQVSAIGAEISNRWSQAKALFVQAWEGLAGVADWVRSIDWRHPFTSAIPSQQPGNKAPPKKNAK
jgi:predicted anti-sigma-YlaC factor YlaD